MIIITIVKSSLALSRFGGCFVYRPFPRCHQGAAGTGVHLPHYCTQISWALAPTSGCDHHWFLLRSTRHQGYYIKPSMDSEPQLTIIRECWPFSGPHNRDHYAALQGADEAPR